MPLVGFGRPRGASVGRDGFAQGWQQPVAEPEIAVHIGKDLAPAWAAATTAKGIAALGPAIELADITCPIEQVETVLDRDIFQPPCRARPAR